jgi:magnesium chelatase subunit I
MTVRPYAEWMWNTNARISTIRIVHSKNVRGSRCAGHVAQRLAVEVDLLLGEVELQVADHVGEDEAHRASLGYEDTVIPQLANALLAGHDVDLPRRARPGQDAHHPLARRPARRVDADRRRQRDQRRPVRTRCRRTRAHLVAERGDDTPIEWVHRDRRFGEKLATPDTSIADLIGEVDPIKVAEGRYLSDELTIHYGLVPRTNRGIFAINELPDLAERIQVGLLNVLEERDVQIRGYKIRLPLDVLLVASANPEDYTNRGRIITPLKDRFGSQIRTHYPLETELEMAIIDQEARPLEAEGSR